MPRYKAVVEGQHVMFDVEGEAQNLAFYHSSYLEA